MHSTAFQLAMHFSVIHLTYHDMVSMCSSQTPTLKISLKWKSTPLCVNLFEHEPENFFQRCQSSILFKPLTGRAVTQQPYPLVTDAAILCYEFTVSVRGHQGNLVRTAKRFHRVHLIARLCENLSLSLSSKTKDMLHIS